MEIILEENQPSDLIKKPEKQNPKESSSYSYNFEHLFSELVEAQSDIESLDNGVQKFFNEYIENITDPNEIKNITKIIKQNNAFQDKINETFKVVLEDDLKENKEKVEKGIKITKQIETKTYQVARAKDMFRELNDMIHGDIISHQKEINKVSGEIKNIQQQVADYEKEIEELNSENKKAYSEELNLLDTVMSFGKKLYTTYVTREEKKKEKNKLEEELKNLKEEIKIKEQKYHESLDDIMKNKENAQKEFQEQKKEIELFLSLYPTTCDDYNNILNSLKKFYKKNNEKYKELKKTQKEKINNKDIMIDINDLKGHINYCSPNILQEMFNQIELLKNLHPYLSFPPNIDINNIVDVVESLTNQMTNLLNQETLQEKINIEREKQMEEIGKKFADVYYDKFMKHLFFNELKLNAAEEKKRKENEKKIQELKDKEEKLKQLQMKYIEQNSQNSQVSSISKISNNSNNSCNSTKDEITTIDTNKKKNYPPEPSPEKEKKSLSSTTSNNNTINIKIKDRKKEEKRKNKMSSINVIVEEEDSKSKSNSKKDSIKSSKEKNEKNDKTTKNERNDKIGRGERNERNESTEKKNINRQKSYMKKGKQSQNKKKKHKKNKKYDDDDYYNDNENEEINESFKKGCGTQSTNNKEKEKPVGNYIESDYKKNKNQVNFPKNNFNNFEDNNVYDESNLFDLNDLNFLTELGEEVNKTEKSYGFGRKNYYRK